MKVMRILVSVVAVALSAMGAAPALAAFPGQNGKIAFQHAATGDIEAVNPDGSGRAAVFTRAGSEHDPAWSPDGKGLAFSSFRNTNGISSSSTPTAAASSS